MKIKNKTSRLLTVLLAVMMVLTLMPLTVMATNEVAIDETNFPDGTFRQYVLDKFDADDNGALSEKEIASVTRIEVGVKSITSLKGVEYFTALTSLNCGYNKLSSLDVSNNKSLKYLHCGYNQLTNLDISNNTNLTELYCYNNQLTSLDVSKNVNLKILECGSNMLTEIDLSNNAALESFSCYGAQLTVLDLSKNTALTYLNCSNNRLTSLDLSKNTALKKLLQCRDNTYEITLNADGTFDLGTLPEGFDIAKASSWTGATVNGTTLKANESAEKATYEYYLGNPYLENNTDIAVFTLTFVAHSHSYGDWKSDENNHWKECVCGEESELGTHDIEIVNAKEATDTEPGYTGDKVCKICKHTVELGEEIPVHTHGYGDWKFDENNHWKECECGDKSETAVHDFEVVNAKEATETEAGYTGDKVCKVCGYVAEKGEEIPATGTGDAPVSIGDIANLMKDVFSKIDAETIKTVFEQTKGTIDNIADIVGPLFDFSDGPSDPTTEPGTDDSTGTTDTDSSTQVPGEDASTGDSDTDASTGDSDTDASAGNSGTDAPNTGAISGITTFAALSVAAAAAFVSKKKRA